MYFLGKQYQRKKICGICIMAQTPKELRCVEIAIKFVAKKEKKLLIQLKKIDAILVYAKKRGYDNLLFAKERIYVCQTRTVLDSTKEYLASLFLHEARHLSQFEKKKLWQGNKAEEGAYRFQRRFLEKYSTPEEIQWLDEAYRGKWWVFTDRKTGKK